MAPNVIGTLRATVSCNMPVKLNEPRSAHVKNPITKLAVAIVSTTFNDLIRATVVRHQAMSTIANADANGRAGITNMYLSAT